MQKPVLKRGNPLLAQVCQPVTDIEKVRPIILDMKDTLIHIAGLYDFKRGHGIAAPQIGHLVRINVVQFDGIMQVLINPTITDISSDQIPIREGCLSFFDVRGSVSRYKAVTVTALDENGCPITIKATDNFAMLLQHELDHLDGILYVDRLPNGEKDLYPVEGMPNIP